NAFSAADGELGRLQAFATVLLKPGVMDPVADSVSLAAHDLKIPVTSVRTFRRYYAVEKPEGAVRDLLFRKILGNEAIEQVVGGPLSIGHLTLGTEYRFQLITVPLRELDDAGLVRVSKEGQLSLNLAEMQTIRAHFRTLGRDP